MALSKKGRGFLYLIIYICFTVAYGAIIALINNLFRTNGIDKAYIMPLLIVLTIYVYWKAWKYLCSKFDKITLDKD